MRTSLKTVSAPNRSAQSKAQYTIDVLSKLGVPVRLSMDDVGAVVEAYVTSGQAARMLAPLGKRAIGMFTPMTGNMVVIEAIVNQDEAIAMLAAMKSLH